MVVFCPKKNCKNYPAAAPVHVQNVENVQNVIPMALKWLSFPQKKLQELPISWGLRPQAPHTGHLI